MDAIMKSDDASLVVGSVGFTHPLKMRCRASASIFAVSATDVDNNVVHILAAKKTMKVVKSCCLRLFASLQTIELNRESRMSSGNLIFTSSSAMLTASSVDIVPPSRFN